MSELRSEKIAALAKALAAAQGEMPTARFDAVNPHFHSNYATIASIIETSKPVLSKHKLAVTQLIVGDTLRTLLIHESGEWLASEVELKSQKQNMQGLGSAITYARRYAWAAIIGLAVNEDEDDGEGTVDRDDGVKRWQDWKVPFGHSTMGKTLEEIAKENPDVLPKIKAYLIEKGGQEKHLNWVTEAIADFKTADSDLLFDPVDDKPHSDVDDDFPM